MLILIMYMLLIGMAKINNEINIDAVRQKWILNNLNYIKRTNLGLVDNMEDYIKRQLFTVVFNCVENQNLFNGRNRVKLKKLLNRF